MTSDGGTLLLTAVRTVVFLLGATTVGVAYRAYRRERSRYLRDATVGFAVITAGVLVEGLLFQFGGLDLTTVHVVESVAVGVGFAVILRSFLV